MWIARDKNNDLCLYKEKPSRNENDSQWFIAGGYYLILQENLFPELKWEDEPIEVNLYSKNDIRNIEAESRETGHNEGYDLGYDHGYNEGHDHGYDEGYNDGELNKKG